MQFLRIFETEIQRRHKTNSNSIRINWNRVLELLKIFTKEQPVPFGVINLKFLEDFKLFILSAPQGGKKKGTVSRNTAVTYFSIFKAALKQAFIDGYLTVDLAAKVKGIPEQESRREYLTIEELNKLAGTDCDRPIIKTRCFIFCTYRNAPC